MGQLGDEQAFLRENLLAFPPSQAGVEAYREDLGQEWVGHEGEYWDPLLGAEDECSDFGVVHPLERGWIASQRQLPSHGLRSPTVVTFN